MKDSREEALQRGAEPPYQELLMLINTNHLHQHDSFLLDPLLSYLMLNTWPHLNVSEIYLLNSQCLIKFLHKLDFHNGTFDIKTVEKNIDKHKDAYIAYVYKSPS